MLRRFGCEVLMSHVSEAKVIWGNRDKLTQRLMTVVHRIDGRRRFLQECLKDKILLYVMEKKLFELKKLKEAIEKERNWKPLKPIALKKVLGFLQGKEKPSKDVLDRLSLFVGFQDWDSFKEAVHGDTDNKVIGSDT